MTVRVLNWGFGTNSTALAVEATNRGYVFDVIVAADTGDEMPESYAYIPVLREWLTDRGQPPPTIVRWVRSEGELRGQFIPISALSLARRELPSKAYGFSGCTSKWKQQPVDRHLLGLEVVQ